MSPNNSNANTIDFPVLAALENILRGYDINMASYIDRVKLYFDPRTSIDTLQSFLEGQDKYNTISLQCLKDHEHLDRFMDWLQPDKVQLNALRDCVRGDYAINYVEVALDFHAQDEAVLNRWRACLERMVVMELPKRDQATRFYYQDYEQTHYHAARNHKLVQVIYRRESQDGTSAPVHLERRISGLSRLREEGLVLIDDLVECIEHPHVYWNQRLDFRMPKWEELGVSLGSQAGTRQGRIKSARSYMKQVESLQQFLASNPVCVGAFKRIPTEKALQELVKLYMG